MTTEQMNAALRLAHRQENGERVTWRSIVDECVKNGIVDGRPIRLLLLSEMPEGRYASDGKTIIASGRMARLGNGRPRLVYVQDETMAFALRVWADLHGCDLQEPD